MEDYLDRFKAMVEELKAHPDVVVTHFHVAEPARERILLRAEDFVDCDLDPSIRTFYSKSNGLQLRWMYNLDPRYDAHLKPEISSEAFKWDAVRRYEFGATGLINILPIEDVFSDDLLWMGTIWFEKGDTGAIEKFMGKEFARSELRRSIRPLDFYSDYANVSAVFQPKTGNPWLTQGTDHHGVYDSNSFFHFEEYLEFLIRSWGIVSLRDQLPWNEAQDPMLLSSLDAIGNFSLDSLETLEFE